MSRIRLSLSAERDLESIHEYTVEQWGEAQAERYVGELEASLERLASFPTSAPETHPGSEMRMGLSGQHRIFYRIIEDGIEVGRILHQAQDFNTRYEPLLG